MERHALDIQPLQQLRREVETGRRRGRRALLPRVDGLVALRVGERLGDVGRQRSLPRRFAVQAQPPPTLTEVLEQLDRAVARAGPQPARRAGERFPETVLGEPLEQ